MSDIAVWKLALYVLGLVAGALASWYLGRKALPWFQKFSDNEQTKDVETARAKVAVDNVEHNQESDELKKIDGR